jgi:hypothetical protein
MPPSFHQWAETLYPSAFSGGRRGGGSGREYRTGGRSERKGERRGGRTPFTQESLCSSAFQGVGGRMEAFFENSYIGINM